MLITIAIKSPGMNVINWCRYWTDLEDYSNVSSNVSNVTAFVKFNVMIVSYLKYLIFLSFSSSSFFYIYYLNLASPPNFIENENLNLLLIFTIGILFQTKIGVLYYILKRRCKSVRL